MEAMVGNHYIGTISWLTSWGMYVELENTVEGFIPIAKIEGDYFEFKEDSYQLIGTHTNTTFHLGQTIKIKVNQVNKLLKTIDFVLVNE